MGACMITNSKVRQVFFVDVFNSFETLDVGSGIKQAPGQSFRRVTATCSINAYNLPIDNKQAWNKRLTIMVVNDIHC